MDFLKQYKLCTEQGHAWNEAIDDIQQCSNCKCTRYWKNKMSYLDNLYFSAKREMDNIVNDPFAKKIYNYIRNDLSGILNGLGDKFATFEFNDFLESDKFFTGMLKIFQAHNFHEQRFDKKKLKEEIVSYLQDKQSNNEFIVGKKQETFFDVWPFNDRELKFFTFIKLNYA